MEPDRTGDGLVEFGGQRIRPDLVGDVVEIELLVDRLAEQARHHAEHGPKAACGCPARIDGTDPYLHRDGCPRQGDVQVDRWLAERESAGLRSDEVRCKLCGHGSDSHRYPETCAECPERVCQP